MSLLTLRHLQFHYESRAILRDVSLCVEPGELCAVMGVNGSGKSTLLRLAAGLLQQPDDEAVTLDGTSVNRLSARERARLASFLPQRFGVHFDTSVLDVVLMGANPELGPIRTPTRRHREQALQILDTLNIRAFAEKNFLTLSEGQKQMVMIARSLLQKSPLLLMDEPDSALDLNNRSHLMETLRAVVQTGKGALLVLHDQQLALTYCDRIFLLHNGVICGQITAGAPDFGQIQAQIAQAFPQVRLYRQDDPILMGYTKMAGATTRPSREGSNDVL